MTEYKESLKQAEENCKMIDHINNRIHEIETAWEEMIEKYNQGENGQRGDTISIMTKIEYLVNEEFRMKSFVDELLHDESFMEFMQRDITEHDRIALEKKYNLQYHEITYEINEL
jgi:hypothetical protein